MKDCDGLRPSKDGKRVRFDGDARHVVDGPFDGTLVEGHWIWEPPVPFDIEIRPIAS